MKKIACLSALACLLAVSAGSAMAKSTVTGGYAQSDFQGVANKANGFNLKYRYENGSDPLGWIGSFTYTEKDQNVEQDFYAKSQYYGLTAGPAYRINDWASIYGVVGVGYGKVNVTGPDRANGQNSDYGVAYGAGLQFNPIEDVAIDAGYEQSRIRSTDIGTWIVGVGYSF